MLKPNCAICAPKSLPSKFVICTDCEEKGWILKNAFPAFEDPATTLYLYANKSKVRHHLIIASGDHVIARTTFLDALAERQPH